MDCYATSRLDVVDNLSTSLFAKMQAKFRVLGLVVFSLTIWMSTVQSDEQNCNNTDKHEKLSLEEHEELNAILSEGRLHLYNGRVYLAREKLGEAIGIIEKRVPAEHPLLKEARILRDEAVALCKWEESELNRLKNMLDYARLAVSEGEKGQYIVALDSLNRAISIADALELKRSSLRDVLLLQMAELQAEAYGTQEALPFYERLVFERRELFGEDNPSTLLAEAALAARMVWSPRVYESELLLHNTYCEIESYIKRLGMDLRCVHALAFCVKERQTLYYLLGEYEKCRALYDWHRRFFDKYGSKLAKLDEESTRVVMFQTTFCEAMRLIAQGDRQAAQERSQQLCALADRTEDKKYRLAFQIRLSHFFAGTSQLKEARERLKTATTLLEPFRTLPPERECPYLFGMGYVNFLEGDLLGAERNLSEGIKMERRLTGDSHPGLLRFLELFANVKEKLGKNDEARQLRQKAAEIRQQIERYKAERDARHRLELPSDIP
jgi:tetratricopeptide (TPR) repeat protein